MPVEPSPPPHARFTGLDGLRAVAVALVVIYHLFPDAGLAGGFVGVDVFFVISGFLITSLLLRERAETGRIALGAFWRRRGRRLLPALALLITVCASAAWVVGGDVLVGVGRQILGAVLFGYNWVAIGGGADYFSAGGSELLRNLWSLAVEEQFYLLWPLLLPLLLLVRRTWLRVGIALALGGASAVWMGAVVLSGAQDPLTLGAEVTRAYFGTDTHAFGLLWGVALAIGWRAATAVDRAWMRTRTARAAVLAAGLGAIAGLGWVAALPETPTVATFPGALLAASLLAGVAVIAGCWPGSWFGRAIDAEPLRWVGARSYGLYLWHWPLLVLLVAAIQGTGVDQPFPWWIGLIALAVTFACAMFSYRFVEMPVRRLGVRGCARAAGVALRSGARARWRTVGAGAVSVVLLTGTVAAVASAPSVSSGAAVVAAGQEALDAQPEPPTPGDPDDAVVTGDEVTAVGDSVMLASAPSLIAAFPGIEVDAAVSRSMYAAPGILRSLAAEGRLRPFVVVGLGTNGSISERTLAEVVDVIGPDRQLILVTASAPRDWIPGVNAEIDEFAAAHRGVQVADWEQAIAPHMDLLAGDQVHPGDAGGRIFADTVADALQRAERTRVRLAAFAEQRAFEQQLRDEHLFRAPGAPDAS